MKIIFSCKLAVYISNKNPPENRGDVLYFTPDFSPTAGLFSPLTATGGNSHPPGQSIPATPGCKSLPATALPQLQWSSLATKRLPVAQPTSCSNATRGENSPNGRPSPPTSGVAILLPVAVATTTAHASTLCQCAILARTLPAEKTFSLLPLQLPLWPVIRQIKEQYPIFYCRMIFLSRN